MFCQFTWHLKNALNYQKCSFSEDSCATGMWQTSFIRVHTRMQHKSLWASKFHTSSGLCDLCLTQHIWLPHRAAVSAVCSACLEGILLETTVRMQEKHVGHGPFLQCLARVLIPDVLHHAGGLQRFLSWLFCSLQFHGSSLQPKIPELCGWNAKCLSLPAELMRAVGTCCSVPGLLGKAKQDVKPVGLDDAFLVHTLSIWNLLGV